MVDHRHGDPVWLLGEARVALRLPGLDAEARLFLAAFLDCPAARAGATPHWRTDPGPVAWVQAVFRFVQTGGEPDDPASGRVAEADRGGLVAAVAGLAAWFAARRPVAPPPRCGSVHWPHGAAADQ